MAIKVMIVEDDINLSEIYQARLQAEGFEIVSAKDGEEALALAVNEHPDLIICDVMMPRISGFDMLDILRGTAGIQDTKVIMMTALSQAEDKARAEKLGANRYLVKSQVTLEDVVKTVHEVLGDKPEDNPPVSLDTPLKVAEPTPGKEELQSEATPEALSLDVSTSIEASAAPDIASGPKSTEPTDIISDQTTTTEQTTVDSQIQNFISGSDQKNQTDNTIKKTPAETPSPMPDSSHSMNKVIEPEVRLVQPDIHTLVETKDSKIENTGQRFDDIAPKPQQNSSSAVEPEKETKHEPDPNQIAL